MFRNPRLTAQLVLDNRAFRESAKASMDMVDDLVAAFLPLDRALRSLTNISFAAGSSLALSMAPGVTAMQRLEVEMAKVEAVAEATTGEMRQMRAAVLELGRGPSDAPRELAIALEGLASAGFDARQIMDLLPVTMEFATASYMSMAQASELLVQAMAAFNIEASEAARVGHVIAAANAVSTADALRLADAFKMVAANAASQNLSLEETTAGLAILIDVFQSGEQAGTGLRNVITRLTSAAPALRDAARDAGIPIQELNPQVVGLGNAVLRLRDLLDSGASAWDIFGDRGQTAANILANAADKFHEVEDGITGTTAMTRQFQIMTNTTISRLRSLQNQITATAISFAQGFKPIIDIAATGLRFFVEILNAIPQPIKTLLGVLTALAGSTLIVNAAVFGLFRLWANMPMIIKGPLLGLETLNRIFPGLATNITAAASALRVWNLTNIAAAASGDAATAAMLRQSAASVLLATRSALLNLVLAPMVRILHALRFAWVAITKIPAVRWALLILLALREMAKHADLLRPALEALRSAFNELVRALTPFEDAQAMMEGFARVVSVVAIGAMTALAHVVSTVASGVSIAAVQMRGLIQLMNPNNWNAAGLERIERETREAMESIRHEWSESAREINEFAGTKLDAVFGKYATAAEALAAQLGMSVEELERARGAIRALYDEAQRSAEGIIFDLDATPLERTLAGITDSVHTMMEDLDAQLEDNPLLTMFDLDGNAVDAIEDSAYGLIVAMYNGAADAARDLAIDQFVRDLQLDLDRTIIEGMEDGRERLKAEYDQRYEELARAEERALRALEENSAEYLEVMQIYAALRLAAREEYARGLAAIDAKILASIEDFERQVVDARISGMDDGEAKIRAQTAVRINRIRRDNDERLAAVEEGSEEHERLLTAEREMVALETAAMDREISAFNAAIAERIRQRQTEYQRALDNVAADLRALAASAEEDPFLRLLDEQQAAMDRVRDKYQEYLADIDKALADGLVTTEQAEAQRAEIIARYGELQAGQLQQNVAEQRKALAQQEADAIAFAQRMQNILDAVQITRTEDPVERERATLRARLAEWDAWYREQVALAAGNAAQLERIETEYQAGRLQRTVEGEQAINDAIQAAREERTRAEIDASQRLAGGVAGVITHDDLTAALERLNSLRDTLLSLGVSAAELAEVNEAIAELSRNITSMDSDGIETTATALATLRAEIRDLDEEQTLTPAAIAERQQARLFAAWDDEVAEFARITRLKISNSEEAERRIAEFTELMEQRKLLTVQRGARERAAAEEARVARIMDLERGLYDERTDSMLNSMRDEMDAEAARYDEDRRRRRREFDQQLTELESTYEERQRLTRAFHAREEALEIEHQRRMAALQARRTSAMFQDANDSANRARQMQLRAAEQAAREAVTSAQVEDIALTQQQIDEHTALAEALREETEALSARNNELLNALTSMPSMREYLQMVEGLFGSDVWSESGWSDPNSVRRLEEQRDLAYQIWQDAEATNVPLQQRSALLRDLIDLNQEVVDAGGRGLQTDVRQVQRTREEYQKAEDAALSAADEYADNTARLAELETATADATTALAGLNAVLTELQESLAALQTQIGQQVFNEVTGQFEDLQEAAENARTAYLDAVTSALDEFLPAFMSRDANRREWPALILEAMQLGELEGAILDLAKASGAALPAGVLQGILDAPAPFTDGESVAEHLGIADTEAYAAELGQRVAQRLGIGFAAVVTSDSEAEDATSEWIENIDASLDPAGEYLEGRSIELGAVAGRGLIAAFADGILAHRATLLAAVDTVLQEVRDRLPSSDAKRGPLSNITYSGGALVTTFASGAAAKRGMLAKSINRTFAHARPYAAIGATRYAVSGGPAGGNSGPTIGQLNVDGRPAGVAPGQLAMSARQLARAAIREVEMQRRTR